MYFLDKKYFAGFFVYLYYCLRRQTDEQLSIKNSYDSCNYIVIMFNICRKSCYASLRDVSQRRPAKLTLRKNALASRHFY